MESPAKGKPPAGSGQEKALRADGAELQNSAAVPMLAAMEVADETEKAAAAPRGKDKERNAYKVLSLVRRRRPLGALPR